MVDVTKLNWQSLRIVDSDKKDFIITVKRSIGRTRKVFKTIAIRAVNIQPGVEVIRDGQYWTVCDAINRKVYE